MRIIAFCLAGLLALASVAQASSGESRAPSAAAHSDKASAKKSQAQRGGTKPGTTGLGSKARTELLQKKSQVRPGSKSAAKGKVQRSTGRV